MRVIAPMMILIMVSSTLAGCTGGDPDGGGNDEIDIENIQLLLNSTLELIEGISNDSGEEMYYMNGNFAYNGTNYQYDQGVWSEVQGGSWTWVGTPANWIDVVTINQKENQMIELHYVSFIGNLEEDTHHTQNTAVFAGNGEWEMNCSNGPQTNLDDGNSELGIMPTPDAYFSEDSNIFPMPGEECNFTLNYKSNIEFSEVWWTVIYSITELTEKTPILINNYSDNNSITEQNIETNTNISMELSYVPSGMTESSRTTAIITIELYDEDAPYHVDSFLTHIENGNYDSTIFHRIIDNFMIQGGDVEGLNGYGGYAANWYGYCNGQQASEEDCSNVDWTLPDEANNGLIHTPGALSMAKTSAANTGGSQFFIVPSDSNPSHLDGVHTVFGYVTSGLDHIDMISEVETGSNDRPLYDVTIINITIDNLDN